jgi:hypothetical protein
MPVKPKKVEAARRGYARGDAHAMQRLLAVLAISDESTRQRELEALSQRRQELAQQFVEESLRREREQREARAGVGRSGGGGGPGNGGGGLEDTGRKRRIA